MLLGYDMTYLIILLPLFLLSCTSTPKPAARPPPTSALIFVPGYYGTSLKDSRTNKRVFITTARYLFGSDPVSLHVRDLATPPGPELVTDAVMDKVRVLPGLFSVDVYGQFMARLAKLANARGAEFVPFAYDWRQDLTETARRLHETVRELRARGITDVEIVAHSMGCLVTAYYLGYGDQAPEDARLTWAGAAEVKRAVLMAGPYRGAFSVFRNMQLGAKIGSNSSYLPAETVASMPASYQLLPMLDFHLFAFDGRRVSFEVADVAQWERHRHGLLKNIDLAEDIRDRRRAFLAAQLTRARAFAQRLEFTGDAPPAELQILQLVGSGNPVVDGAYYDPADGAFVFDTQNLKKHGLRARTLFKDGDGTVTMDSARLPAPLRPRARVLTTTKVHERVFDDEKFIDELARF